MHDKFFHDFEDISNVPIKQYNLQQIQSREVLDHYIVKEQVGKGMYGEVFKAVSKDINDKKLYALKKLIVKQETHGFPQTSLREIKILQRLDHQNIIKINEIATETVNIKNKNRKNITIHTYIIFDYMEHNFYYLIRKTQLKLGHIKCVMKQILEGLNYLHSKNIIHRDLKTQNILVNNQGVVKIADFGLARYLEKFKYRPLTPIVVTLWYRSPEILLGDKNYDQKCDIWSAGIIMLEMLFNDCPFKGQTETAQIDAIFKKCGTPTEETWPGIQNLRNYKDLMPEIQYECNLQESIQKQNPELDNTTLDFISSLLSLNPEFRYSAKQALDHKYFKDPPQIIPLSDLSIIKDELHEILIESNNQTNSYNNTNNNSNTYQELNYMKEQSNNFKRDYKYMNQKRDLVQESPELEVLYKRKK